VLEAVEQTLRPYEFSRQQSDPAGDREPSRSWRHEHDDSQREQGETANDPDHPHVVFQPWTMRIAFTTDLLDLYTFLLD